MLFFCGALLTVCYIIGPALSSYSWITAEVWSSEQETNTSSANLSLLHEQLKDQELGTEVNGTANITRGVAMPSNCPVYFDYLLYWPETPVNGVIEIPCAHIEYLQKSSGYATRECLSDGLWDLADYSACLSAVNQSIDRIDERDETLQKKLRIQNNASYILLAGYTVSNLSMILAIFIFIKFQQFKCLRNLIHCQLLIAMTLKNFMWIVLYIFLVYYKDTLDDSINCTILMALFQFFHYATFSWMFVEGFYLFLVIVKAFTSSQLKPRHCATIGWGIPAVATLIWIPLKVIYHNEQTIGCSMSESFTVPANIHEMVVILAMLTINVLFMASVIYTLVRKLQHTILNEGRQYRKAVRATVILIPLLGGAYLLLFLNPGSPNRSVSGLIWFYVNAIIQSTQGFVVALVYCFLNKEVKSSIRKCHRRWKDEKSLPSFPGQWWTSRRRSSATPTTTTTTTASA